MCTSSSKSGLSKKYSTWCRSLGSSPAATHISSTRPSFAILPSNPPRESASSETGRTAYIGQ